MQFQFPDQLQFLSEKAPFLRKGSYSREKDGVAIGVDGKGVISEL